MSMPGRHWPAAALIAVGLLIFVGPLAVGRIGLWGDNLIQNFPLRVLVGHIIDTGHFPLWNSFDWSGTPLLAGFNAGALYPLTLLFAAMPPSLAWCLGEVFTFAVGALGLYCFLIGEGLKPWSAAAGSMVWTAGGAFSGQWVHIATVQSASWVPWALVSIQRMARASGVAELALASAIGALAAGMILLSGSPEMAVYGFIPALCYFCFALPHAANRAYMILMAVFAVAVGAMIGAVQWLPGLDFIVQSQRSQSTFAFFNSFAMPPRLTAMLFVPYLLGGYGYGATAIPYFGPLNLPEVSGYMGLLPLMAFFATLSAWWRKNSISSARVWHVVAMVGLVLAWGGDTPMGVAMYHVPGYGLLRDQSRNLLEVDLALAVLAALWLDRSSLAMVNSRWAGIPLAVAGAVAAAYAMSARGVVRWVSGLSISSVQARAAAPAVWATVALVVAFALLLGFAARRRWCIPAFMALMVVNLGLYASGQYWTHPTPTTVLRGAHEPWLTHSFRGKSRIAIYDPSLSEKTILDAVGQPDLNVLSGVYSVQGYGSIVSKRYFGATGAHAQLAYKPRALHGQIPNSLNLGWLMARPDDFCRQIKPGQRAPRHLTLTLRSHQSTWMYLGRLLTIQQLRVVISAPISAGVRLTTMKAQGRRMSSKIITVHPQQEHVVVSLPDHHRNAIGIQVTNLSDAAIDIRQATVLTRQGQRYSLDGQLMPYVRYPHWRYIKNMGRMVIFRNMQTHGWAWLQNGAGPLQSVRVSHQIQGGLVAEVHTTTPVQLVVSQSYARGWCAYIYRPSKPVLVVPATRHGVIQSYRLPAGFSRVYLRYRPPLFMWGMVTTLAGLVLLISIPVMARRQIKYTFTDRLNPAP